MKEQKQQVILFFTLILCAIVAMFLCYPSIVKDAAYQQYPASHIESYETEVDERITQDALASIFPLYALSSNEQSGYERILYDHETLSTQQAQEVNDVLKEQQRIFRENNLLEYQMIEHANEKDRVIAYRGTQANLEALLDPTKGTAYEWYLVLSFDENGILSVERLSSSLGEIAITDMYYNSLHDLFAQSDSLSYQNAQDTYTQDADQKHGQILYFTDSDASFFLQGPRNVTFAFGCDTSVYNIYTERLEQENTYYVVPNYPAQQYFTFISVVLCIALLFTKKYEWKLEIPWQSYYHKIPRKTMILLVFVLLLFSGMQRWIYTWSVLLAFSILLMKGLKKISPDTLPGYDVFAKLPIEIWLLFTGIMMSIISNSGQMVYDFYDENFYLSLSSIMFQLRIVIGNILLWFLSFTYVGYSFVYWMELVIQKRWKEHSYIVRGWRRMKHKIHTIYQSFMNLDLNDRIERKMLILFIVNYILLCIFASFWVFSWFFLFIYSLFVYYYLRNYVVSARKDYKKLLDATTDMAKGNLEENIDVDLGMFESFKEDILSIQTNFKKAVEDEIQSQRMKTELITNVSHDLKTPLTSIISYIDLLQKEGISKEEQMQYMKVLDQNAQRLKHLIEDLFEVSKASSGAMQLECMEVDICALMQQVLIEMDADMKKRNLTVKYTSSHEKITCYLDPQRTYRIFENLVGNITKYALASTRVYIDIQEQDQDVSITMKNISANELNIHPDELMERFVRGDDARNSEGSGLGLAIANSIAQLQKGTMHLEIDGDLFKVVLCLPKYESKPHAN